MLPPGLVFRTALPLCWTGMSLLGTVSCARTPQSAPVPPAPIVFRWPDPAYAPARQCREGYAPEELERYLPRARLTLWLPSTIGVALDEQRHCITVTVADVGAGRLAELVLRGVAVPRQAVLLRLAEPL